MTPTKIDQEKPVGVQPAQLIRTTNNGQLAKLLKEAVFALGRWSVDKLLPGNGLSKARSKYALCQLELGSRMSRFLGLVGFVKIFITFFFKISYVDYYSTESATYGGVSIAFLRRLD